MKKPLEKPAKSLTVMTKGELLEEWERIRRLEKAAPPEEAATLGRRRLLVRGLITAYERRERRGST